MIKHSFAISHTKFDALLDGKTIKIARVVDFDLSVGATVSVQCGGLTRADATVVAITSRFFKLKQENKQ